MHKTHNKSTAHNAKTLLGMHKFDRSQYNDSYIFVTKPLTIKTKIFV